jgi:hypothetical protein
MSIETINPLLIAAKLDAVRNFLFPEVQEDIEKAPRLVQTLWFLQWLSVPENYAGGLARFAHDLIQKYADKIGPESLRFDCEMTVKEIEAALGSMAGAHKFYPKAHAMWAAAFYSSRHGLTDEEDKEYEQLRRAEISGLTASKLHKVCTDAAQAGLAEYLFALCSNPGVTFFSPETRTDKETLKGIGRVPSIWYFPRLWECIFDFMDRHSVEVGGGFAETSITREIFHWLHIAQDTKKGVMFLGHSRFGKSHAIRAFARIHPWSVRLVECPASGSESDLLRELCRALGIRFSSTTPPLHEQRGAIDKVIRAARFLLIFDEAQMLYPQNGNRRTAPPRLNYVRRQLMDIGIPTAFICTHQSWRQVENNYLKFSGFAQEQFEGRLVRSPIHLQSELTEAEMLEVARVHLPELDADYLQYLVAPIRACKGDHLSYIENIALIARRYAAQRRLSVPQLEDLKKAISDVLGCFQAPATAAADDPENPPIPARRNLTHNPRTAAPAARAIETAPSRSTVPAGFRKASADLPELAVTG